MDLYFIRHAQSANNALWAQTNSDKGRVADPHITELGRKQAELLGEFLRTGNRRGGRSNGAGPSGFGITHLYASLMIRAVETGTAVSRALDLPLHGWEDIHEEGGIFLRDEQTGEPVGLPGCDRAFFEANFPDFCLPQGFNDQGWWNNRPMEPIEDRPKRVRRFLDQLLAEHGGTDHRVAIVSHGGFYNLLIKTLLGQPLEPGVWFTTYNCGVSWIEFLDRGINIQYLNRTDFLPAEMIT